VHNPSRYFRNEEISHEFSKCYVFGDFKWTLQLSSEKDIDEYYGWLYLICEDDELEE
jgi:hypothetical protein